jgi:hypothetical protein
MAESSITTPVVVSGIRVPGISGNETEGPLSKLYANKFENNIYRFPSDLGAPNRGHVITFTVKKQRESNVDRDVLAQNLRDVRDQFGNPTNFSEVSSGIANVVSSGAGSNLFNSFARIRPPKTNGDTVALYVPDTVNVQYAARYEDVSLTNALGKPLFLAQGAASVFNSVKDGQGTSGVLSNLANDPFARTLALGAIDRTLSTNITQFGLSALGVAFNPQLQVLFSNIGFRQFQFYFLLAPKNNAESAAIQNIIKTFKYASAPEFKEGVVTDSIFLKVPDTFEIKFLFNGEENLNVNRIGECVLESIDVDYSPNGWSSFNDGSAVQTLLTLQFKEIFIIDKNRVNEGY